METFSVELQFSASSKPYPQNTIPPFTNFLPDQINLEDEREVALTEICFPSKFFNITQESFGISATKRGKVKNSEKDKLSPVYYPTIKSIVAVMFAKVFAGSHFRNLHNMESKFIDFSVDIISQRVLIKSRPGLKIVLDSEEIQHIFGFMPSNETLKTDNKPSTSPFVHDTHRFHEIFIYTDFIEKKNKFGRCESSCIEKFSD